MPGAGWVEAAAWRWNRDPAQEMTMGWREFRSVAASPSLGGLHALLPTLFALPSPPLISARPSTLPTCPMAIHISRPAHDKPFLTSPARLRLLGGGLADLNGPPVEELMKKDSDGQLGDGDLNQGVAAGTRRGQGS